MFETRRYRPGDLVIYRKTKHAPVPGPRAASITAAPNGDNYSYNVDKFWIVDRIRDNGDLVLRTRRGKTHTRPPDDPNLRHAGLMTRLLNGWRFPQSNLSTETSATQP